jgi:hypothetical protein
MTLRMIAPPDGALDRPLVLAPQPGVDTASRKEITMRTVFGYPAVIDEQNPVCADHARHPMGDHEHGLARGKLLQAALDKVLVLRIGERRGLVEHNDRSVLQNGPGKNDPLLLAAGEIRSLDADAGAQPFGKLVDDLAALREVNRAINLIDRCGGAAVAWKTKDTRFISCSDAISTTSEPPTIICPSSVSQNRGTSRAIVVLPLPEGPTSARVVPSAISNEIPSMAFLFGPG